MEEMPKENYDRMPLFTAAEGYLAPSIAVSSIPIVFTVLAFLLFGGLLTVRLIKRNSYDLVG